MSKEWDKFEKDFKATKPRLKTLAPIEGKKLKKEVLAWLDQTWKLEDKVAEAVEQARKDGVTGSKAADFAREKPFTSALKDWKAAVTKHHANVDRLTEFADEAQVLHDELSKRCDAIDKDLKKAKTSLANVKIVATVKEARRALPDLRKSGGFGSSLPGHAVFYARKLPQSVEAIVKQTLSKIDPKEFPKSMQADQRARTLRQIAGHQRKAVALCRAGEAGLEKDSKKAGKALEAARKELAAIEKFNDEFTAVAKKMRKEINDAKDKKEIIALIKAVNDAFKTCDAACESLDDKLDAAQAET